MADEEGEGLALTVVSSREAKRFWFSLAISRKFSTSSCGH